MVYKKREALASLFLWQLFKNFKNPPIFLFKAKIIPKKTILTLCKYVKNRGRNFMISYSISFNLSDYK